jgi:hypothetical protein
MGGIDPRPNQERNEAMADETAEQTFTKAAAEHEAKETADRERFAAQSWYELDHRLTLLLAPIFEVGNDATIELTVVVDGTVISGSVVSEQAWAQRQNDQIRVGSPVVADALEAVESKAGEQKLKAAEEARLNPRLKTQNRYIHFLGPVLLSGGVHVRLQATRVDLRKVSAWSIGRIPGE